MTPSYSKSNQTKHSDSFSIVPSAPFQSCACWLRYASKEMKL